jgi:D-alanyl-D-alanine carboxypeptidase/D-alanyl-D-alanine-endopeptidase (penicillin-binding protein 4)
MTHQETPLRALSHVGLVHRLGLMCLALALSGCMSGSGLKRDVVAPLSAAGLEGVRWGLVVTTLDGEELIAIRPEERFTPASNTKLLTTAALFHSLKEVSTPDPSFGPSLRLEENETGGAPDLVIVGGGDGRLGDGPDCEVFCLRELAASVRQASITEIDDLIGDDTLFPDERWGAGWSWNNLETRSGAAVSALSVNNNELWLTVSPASAAGGGVTTVWRTGDDLLPILNEATTVLEGPMDLTLERRPGGEAIRLYGRMPIGSAPRTLVVSLEDPALAAAERLKRILEDMGVKVRGKVLVRHRPPQLEDDPARRGQTPVRAPQSAGIEIARLIPPPLIEDLSLTTKTSQNLHAELLLRRLGLMDGTGSAADGLARIGAMLKEAGQAPPSFTFADGSGMSVYNRVTPRMMAAFLRWAASQSWSDAWRNTLPIGGVDGNLANRFRDGPLRGRIWAKTGTLNGVNALAGYMIADSGRMLAFAMYANDRPPEAASATIAMDRTLEMIARRR